MQEKQRCMILFFQCFNHFFCRFASSLSKYLVWEKHVLPADHHAGWPLCKLWEHRFSVPDPICECCEFISLIVLTTNWPVCKVGHPNLLVKSQLSASCSIGVVWSAIQEGDQFIKPNWARTSQSGMKRRNSASCHSRVGQVSSRIFFPSIVLFWISHLSSVSRKITIA